MMGTPDSWYQNEDTEYEVGKRRPSESTDPAVRKMFDFADAKGITTVELARRSGYSVRSVYGLRHGSRNGSYSMVKNIAQALGGDLDFSIQPRRKGT